MNIFRPSDYQLTWKPEDFIVQTESAPEENSIQMDVLFVGAGPASLSSAIRLADLAKSKGQDLQIAVMEKAEQLGGHTLSGALVNPLVFQWLFPEKTEKDFPFGKKVTKESFYYLSSKKAFPFPVPPGMRSKGCYTASLCELVRFLGREAEKRGVHILTSFPVEKLLMQKNKVIGVLSKPYGLNRDGKKESNAEPGEKIFAKVVVLSEGSRGHLTQSYLMKEKIQSKYPQTYALGVKEVWEVSKEPKGILHSIGWPLDSKTFGGSWFYPLGKNLVSIGLVMGLDSSKGEISVHEELQKMKEHSLFQQWLKGGKCLEWGAKTIPEGGYHALPERWHGAGLLMLGDSVGFVNMASLKGIHYAMASGYYAAETLSLAFERENFSASLLKEYDVKIKNSFIVKALYRYRNLRQSFQKGLFQGLFKAGLITLTKGFLPRDFKKTDLVSDCNIQKYVSFSSVTQNELSKEDAVFLSGNQTRDKIPSHLLIKDNIPKNIALFYEKLCPAGVYEYKDKLHIKAPNCIDCKATDVLGPRWTPRERGSGPNYKRM